ncbi:tetratricopeptide repeat protein [Winogradskyella rapida]|uniref:Tetratricopeptide repeat protein n=1 Tax=Winogradskyella rapida TaxID=549701 RepID=A0ABW3KKQ6_9FLAO
MTELQIKEAALKAFNNQDYPKAFNILWELGVDGFLEYSQRNDRRTKKFNWLSKNWKRKSHKGYSYFWNTFVLKENVFTACFSSKRPVELLHNYFSKTDVFNELLEIKLAKEYPSIFIEAIRKNEVFFREDRIDFLLKDDLLKEEYQIHQDVWESFQIEELHLWKEIEAILLDIEKHPLEHILFFTIEYFETNNFETNFDIVNQSTLAGVYSFFIDLILRNSNIKQEGLSSEQFEMDFVKSVYESEYIQLKKLVFKCLNYIKKRQVFNSRFFQPYCFNSKFQPRYIYESLHFYESPESYYQWNVDEIRYKVSELVYSKKGSDIVEKQIENAAVIHSRRREDYLDNKTLACNLQALIEVLRDLKLTHFYLKEDNKSVKVEVEKIIKPLYVYAFNRYTRYYKVLKSIKASNSLKTNNWQIANLHLVVNNQESSQFPFIYSSEEEYLDLNTKADQEFKREIGLQVLNQFGFKRLRLKRFDRFNVRYSVIDTPFVILDNYIFCPILFFINFSSQNVYVNSLLKNNNRDTAIQIEDVLNNLLVKHKFNVKHPTKKEVDLVDGDSDLILFDNDNVLLIQVKRTNLRLDYKAQYNELINTDLKAANQLNNAEKYFSNENSIFKIGNRKVTKWIVSNSFEKVNTTINDCLKVNYLDIVSFLSNTEGMTFKTLPNFISFFNTDTYFTKIAKPLIDNVDAYKEIFSLTKMNARNFLWKDFDSFKAKKYSHYYKKGIELNRKGEHNNGIKALNECLKLEKEDVEVHGAIANMYADIGNYEKAFFHFNKALEIISNNPFVLRNYAIALRESGDESFKEVYSQITNKYPFLNMS